MAAPTSTIGSARSSGAPRPEWVSVHVFYAGDADPLLVQSVAPLIGELREAGLITRYFFIRYWLEGPHVRLRVLPAPGVPTGDVASRVEAHVESFLLRHPAPDPQALQVPSADHYRRMFLAEYDLAAWERKYGQAGGMPLRANNSYLHVPYEPEYRRYGGRLGMEVAEWHFEQSSDVVLRLLAARPAGRSIRLGLSAQLGLIMCGVFLGDKSRVAEFLARYRDDWEKTYTSIADLRREYDNRYLRLADHLRPRAELILANVTAATHRRGSEPAPDGSQWLAHCRRLRKRVVDVAMTGRFASYDGSVATVVTDPDVAMEKLLPSYLHMTNNRLGISVMEEAYIVHLLRSALLHVPPERGN